MRQNLVTHIFECRAKVKWTTRDRHVVLRDATRVVCKQTHSVAFLLKSPDSNRYQKKLLETKKKHKSFITKQHKLNHCLFIRFLLNYIRTRVVTKNCNVVFRDASYLYTSAQRCIFVLFPDSDITKTCE